MTYTQQTAGINEEQKAAVETEQNAVIAAGAGSGKTRVLATRYLYLILHKNTVEEILALTFTRKAAAEMRGRIYGMLAENGSPEAKAAAAAFHAARIETLDSFCASICREGCRAYGITPAFAIDDGYLEQKAEQAALDFILRNRESKAVRALLKTFSLRDLPGKLLVQAVIRHSSVSSPLDFSAIQKAQWEKINAAFSASVSDLTQKIQTLRDETQKAKNDGKTGDTLRSLCAALSGDFSPPDPQDKDALLRFAANCVKVVKVPKRINKAEIKETQKELEAETGIFFSIVNFIRNEEIIQETFRLLSEFQEIFNGIKRESAILTFRDISCMAVDLLRENAGLRSHYRRSVRKIMIDEFQDNNELQKELLYWISGKNGNGGMPSAAELEENKLFFVGDEKQSIYRFRGADVSVFRKLKTELDAQNVMPRLSVNYRTEKSLLEIFNLIFPRIFLRETPENPLPGYEAEFSPIGAHRETPGCKAGLEILLADTERFQPEDKTQCGKTESEAMEIAERIRNLVGGGFPVRGKDGAARPCTYSDIAILFRSTGKQREFERQLRRAGIPYQSEAVSGLFTDAPANDFLAFLRLAINPEDSYSYAVVLRSPFVEADDETIMQILIRRAEAAEKNNSPSMPFSAEDIALASGASKENLKRAQSAYGEIRSNADTVPLPQIISSLWYTYGYRRAVTGNPASAHYAEIYDFLFELARQAEARALSLSDFLDEMDKKIRAEEKFDEIDIPTGKDAGVKLMTVHKSKGLEFPVVFLADAGNRGKNDQNDLPFYFSPETSVTINTELPEEFKALTDIKSTNGNFFYKKAKEENQAKTLAETRRLLYVAMTRAEMKIFVSGNLSLKTEDGGPLPEEPRTGKELLAVLQEKKSSPRTFLDLLLPAVAALPEETPGVRISEILPKPAQARMQKPESGAIPFRPDCAPCTDYKAGEPARIPASKIREAQEAVRQNSVPGTKRDTYPYPVYKSSDWEEPDESGETDAIGAFLRRNNILPEEFGTYVHAAIEETFTGERARIPPEARKEAEKLAARFFASDTGIKARQSSWRRVEYGFLIKANPEILGEKVISGKMDLIFLHEGNLYLVDYKTDKTENPQNHREQLLLYKEAARKLFGAQFPAAEIITLVYYLRSGNIAEIT